MKKALSGVKEVCERLGVTKDFSELLCQAVELVRVPSILFSIVTGSSNTQWG